MERRQRKPDNSGQIMHLVLILLFLFLTVCLLVKACIPDETEPEDNDVPKATTESTSPNNPQSGTTDGSKVVTATASIGVTGDVMGHGPVLKSALQEDGSYDFTSSFRYIAPYYSSYDFMIANLEVTLGGPAAGEYRGYPTFNCPDSMVDALKGAGVDMVLTTNNHAYDTGHAGFLRTQEVLSDKGMQYLGTRLNKNDAAYVVQDINGIKVGMISYTYETGDNTRGNKTLNNIAVSKDDTDLINSFNYKEMDQFYQEVTAAVAAMEAAGADTIMFFIHWGNEYEKSPSKTQRKIAQNLCDLGIDVIVGGHPHVVQPMEVLTSASGEKTYCLYSTGNAISNQRREEIKSAPEGHSEDGMIFGIEFQRWSDGTVTISDLNVTPLWVSLDEINGKSAYTILPVDITYKTTPVIGQFADVVNGVIAPDRPPVHVETFVPTDVTQIGASYYRTMNIVLNTLNQCRQDLGLSSITNSPGG